MIIYNSEIYHYGIPRRSGRYKWGSGKDPYHHGADGGTRTIRKKAKLLNRTGRREYEQIGADYANQLGNEGKVTTGKFSPMTNKIVSSYHNAAETIADPNTSYRKAKKAYKQAKRNEKQIRGFNIGLGGTPRSHAYGNSLARQYLVANKATDTQRYGNYLPGARLGYVGKYSFAKIDDSSVRRGWEQYKKIRRK